MAEFSYSALQKLWLVYFQGFNWFCEFRDFLDDF